MADLKLNLYFDRAHPSLNLDVINNYLKSLGFKPNYKGDFYLANNVDSTVVAEELARLRITDLNFADSLNSVPSAGDVESEFGFLKSNRPITLKSNFTNIYSGFHLARLLRGYAGPGLHIVYTSRLPATFEGARYHGRVIVACFPLAIISTTGVVEAPARSREFYIQQAAYHNAKAAGFSVPAEPDFMAELEGDFEKQFIGYSDSRMTEVVQGYTLQAAFYLLFGEAFCNNMECRLFNAHTQAEMMHAQLESGGLCKHHQAMLETIFQHK